MKNEWIFRISVSDEETILVMAFKRKDISSFMIRYFVDEENASSWIEECSEGKHIDR